MCAVAQVVHCTALRFPFLYAERVGSPNQNECWGAKSTDKSGSSFVRKVIGSI